MVCRHKPSKTYNRHKKGRLMVRFPRKCRRRKKVTGRSHVHPHERKLSGRKKLPHIERRDDRMVLAGDDTFVIHRRYPFAARDKIQWTSRPRYDVPEDWSMVQNYDYIFPEFLQEDDYSGNMYDDIVSNRRHYRPFKRGYAYRGGRYYAPKSPNYLLPIFCLIGLLGIIINLGIGKKIARLHV